MSGLIERIEAGEASLSLEVLIEVAMFQPCEKYTAIRANHAGTKVIMTHREDGREGTFWPSDWCKKPMPELVAALRAGGVK